MAHRLGTSASDIVAAVDYLRSGGVVGVPTETVYGLAASAFDIEAISEIYRLKNRPANNPLILHIHHSSQIERLADTIPEMLPQIVDQFWPGPLTVVLKARPDVPAIVRGGGDTVGIRIPNHPTFLQLLASINEPLAAPSANRSNHVSPTTAAHVESDFPTESFPILDAGPTATGLESTVLSLVGPPTVLRLGSTSITALREILPNITIDLPDQQIESPGTSKRHYAPKTPFHIWSDQKITNEDGVLLFGGPPPEQAAHVWDLGDDPTQAGKKLYATLREMDQTQLRVLYVVLPNEKKLMQDDWLAIMDRLRRATQSK